MLACAGTPPTAPDATVYFRFEAPFCGFRLPVRFAIDGATVGVDTFRVNVGADHLISNAFSVTPGSHVLTAFAFTGTWPDTTVTLGAGSTFVRILPFYCS